MEKEWRVGQDVYHQRGSYDTPIMTTVARVTKTSVECADGTKWTLAGRKWGAGRDTWNWRSLSDLGPEMKARFVLDERRHRARTTIANLAERADDITDLDKLERVVAAMREALNGRSDQ